jgi:beta-glucanase (GH16 family)
MTYARMRVWETAKCRRAHFLLSQAQSGERKCVRFGKKRSLSHEAIGARTLIWFTFIIQPNQHSMIPVTALFSLALVSASLAASPAPSILPGGAAKWQLAWSDEFDYPDAQLEQKWVSQNSGSKHILSSRWRENAKVEGGTLKLINRKESRGGNDWTSGNVWTKQQFQYGYFECRYRYAAAEGTNNSFWLMTNTKVPAGKKAFEIDINEGHYPNEVNTNIHNWSDIKVVNGKKTHPSSSKGFSYGVQPEVNLTLEIPIKTRRLRMVSQNREHIHLGEFRIYGVNAAGYPKPSSRSADRDVPRLVNYARDRKTQVSVSGCLLPGSNPMATVTDGDPTKRWVSQKQGSKWVEFRFPEERQIGCIQFVQGWQSHGRWHGMMDDYRVEYHNGKRWVEISSFDIKKGSANFARDFHTYGLEWSEKELVFYLDGKAIRREKNAFCHSPSPVWLSLAIIAWAGKITDSIHGTYMEVDYVRVYNKKP